MWHNQNSSEILLIRHLTALTALTLRKHLDQPPSVISNTLTPDACKSDSFREGFSPIQRLLMALGVSLFARSTNVGARTLVPAAAGGVETHGRYNADGVVSEESPFARCGQGARVGERVWEELMRKSEKLAPGIGRNV